MFGAEAAGEWRKGVWISETIRAPLIEVIGQMGREVVGFMSSSQQRPSLFCFVFVLATSSLVEVVGGDDEDSD